MEAEIEKVMIWGLEMTKGVISAFQEHWYIVVGFAVLVGIIVGIAKLFAIRFSMLSPEKQYKIRLRRRYVKPKYSLRSGDPITDYPGKLVSGAVDLSPYVRFVPATLVNEGDKLEFDVKLELTEPTNRWTFRPYEGIAAITGWNHETNPSAKTPRRSFINLLERGSGVRLGAICINQEKEGGGEQYLSWKFTCLGVTVGEGKNKIE